MFKNAFALLQKMGRSLMLPVSVLPAAGILLGVGSAGFSWMPEQVSTLMAQAGGAVFTSLPLLFAIAVALGLTQNDGVASLAAVVGFFVMLATMGVVAPMFGVEPKNIFGINSVDTGVFGGMLIGGIAAWLFNRYFRIQLPAYLGFFAGKRFVPIVTAFAAILTGLLLAVVWPPIGAAIRAFSHWAAYTNPQLAVFIYGVVERLLLPFGLHHIWNVPFFFEIGSFTKATGEVVHGDITRFFAGDPEAGILGGAYLFKMWGLPAAALAMWRCARPDQRKKVGGIMLSAALTSFLTGITEPIEFSFLFVAPMLYALHAFLAGCAQLLFQVLGAKLGFTFSHGFIDFVLYYTIDTKPWLVLLIGPLWGVLYFTLFRWAILRFDLKTPGRDVEEPALVGAVAGPSDALAGELVAAFGGRDNITSLDACITRLRATVRDRSAVNTERLKALGATGVVMVGQNAQAIFGTRSENLKTDIEHFLRSGGGALSSAPQPAPAPVAQRTPEVRPPGVVPQQIDGRVAGFVKALGGAGNVRSVEAVAGTRIRVQVVDDKRVDSAALRAAGAHGVMLADPGVVHVLVGLGAENYLAALRRATTLILCIAATCLVACGGSSPAAPSPPPTQNPPPAPTVSACSALGATASGASPFSIAIVNGAECSSAASPVVLLNMRHAQGFALGACSGTIITPRAILTAAHCLDEDVATVRVWLGSGNEIVAESFSFHPTYRPNSATAIDVGIVMMSEDLPRTPVPLLQSRDVQNAEAAVIAGWGRDQASVGATLRAGRTTITAVGGLFLESVFSTTASSICLGDSGGPILVSQGGGWAIAGVSSAASVLECNAGTNFYVNIRNSSASSFILNLVPGARGV